VWNLYKSTHLQLLIFYSTQIRGKYEYMIAISPDQPIKRLQVDVRIVEQRPLRFVRVPPFATEQTNVAKTDQPPPGSNVTLRYCGKAELPFQTLDSILC